ncbi:Ribulose kinase [Gemmobacter aquatilis]|uniref:Ribulose kinase n=1 Tax=Gemmobacter aquatilis TaxID=933059 RepID=A0A1H7Y878_9RHOB|nr:FGGY family carbohydrate kinase [Gemmobacter aquatilis]SEM42372.1 Ribulose kinase [Gemmobacter aquatilis]
MTMTQTPVTIGLDCGTGGARALVADLQGRVLAMATVPYDTQFPRTGWATQDPADWWRASVLAVRQALAEAGVQPGDVRAICADGTSSTLVALGADLQPLAPAILWMDNRASPQARRIEATGHPALRRSRGGVSAETMIPKILWIKDNDPALFDRTRWFVEMSDYIALRLSGEVTLGLNQTINRWFHDPRRGGWPEDLFAQIGLPGLAERFPTTMLPLGAPIGPLAPDAAAALGLGAQTLVVCGGTDAYVAMVGLNTLASGQTAFITGSSHLVLPMTDRDVEIEGVFGPHPDCVVPGLFVMEGGQVSSGSVIRWWHDQMSGGRDSYAAMMAAAEAVPLGANGLVALDFWQGNRNPHIDYDLQGAIWGLTLKHGTADITRALMESVCFGTRNILARLAEGGVAVETMTIAGGTVRSPFWLQMHADTANVPLIVPEVTEATAFGAAITAAVGAGAYAALPEAAAVMVRAARVIEPDAARHRQYEDLFGYYRDTHTALRPLMHRMADRQRASPAA